MKRAASAIVLGAAVALTIYGSAKADKPTPKYEWKSIDKKYWQIVTPAGEAPEVTDAREGNRGACGAGMVEITGKMRVSYMGDFIQQSVCKNWINKDFPERCAEFDRDKWLALTAKLPQKDMHFCIDRFEYPNRKGEYPLIMVDWNEAEKLCHAQSRRLCTEDEWTFACEGEEAMPYPYGYVRDANACLVDKTWRQWEGSWARGRDREDTMREVDRLWQGVPSGSMPKCKSVFGVYDLVGNVDEWTRSTSPTGNKSILKGGYWGPVRTRCRPTTRIHGESHVLYQESLRCCSDLK